jgi:hypothetical protein
MKPKRITISLVVNSVETTGTLERSHTMNRNIGRCRMGEHDAGPVVICEDQRALERTWCQHDPIGTDMPDPDARTLAGAEFPRWSLRRSMATT